MGSAMDTHDYGPPAVKKGSVPETLRRIAASVSSGTAIFKGAAHTVFIYFGEGRVVGANCPTQPAHIGERLVGAEVITEVALEAALNRQAKLGTGKRIGEILVEMGVPASAIEDALREYTVELIRDLDQWSVGEFRFDGGNPAELIQPLRIDDVLRMVETGAPVEARSSISVPEHLLRGELSSLTSRRRRRRVRLTAVPSVADLRMTAELAPEALTAFAKELRGKR